MSMIKIVMEIQLCIFVMVLTISFLLGLTHNTNVFLSFYVKACKIKTNNDAILLKYHADVSILNSWGSSPLSLAAFQVSNLYSEFIMKNLENIFFNRG